MIGALRAPSAHARVSAKCRQAARKEEPVRLWSLENDLDNAAAQLWGITPKELEAIQAEVSPESDEGADAAALED